MKFTPQILRCGPLLVLGLVWGGWGAEGAPVLVGRTQALTEQFLPGPELRVKPDADGREPVVLRITAARPQGTAGFRYDLVWSALEVGKYDLARWMEPANGVAAVALPEIAVEAVAVLPPGPPAELPPARAAELPRLGGYRIWGPVLGLVWLAGGITFFWMTRKRKAAAAAGTVTAGRTLAEQLRPLLEKASAGPLDTAEKAAMERLVLGFGRQRLGLSGAGNPSVWQALRADGTTRAWLQTLESWLHRPSPEPPSPDALRDLLQLITATPDRPVPVNP